MPIYLELKPMYFCSCLGVIFTAHVAVGLYFCCILCRNHTMSNLKAAPIDSLIFGFLKKLMCGCVNCDCSLSETEGVVLRYSSAKPLNVEVRVGVVAYKVSHFDTRDNGLPPISYQKSAVVSFNHETIFI